MSKKTETIVSAVVSVVMTVVMIGAWIFLARHGVYPGK
jgi:hypothetical protein